MKSGSLLNQLEGQPGSDDHRMMVALLKGAASRIWISCEAWRDFFRGARAPVNVLPVPSNVRDDAAPEKIAALRQQFCRGRNNRLMGHFGIGDALVENQLRQFIPGVLRKSEECCFLLIGKSGERLAEELRIAYPEIAPRIFASGILSTTEISAYIGACDLMVQPYIDGMSTRRTAAMAALASGRALLTTEGHSTEPFWTGCSQVAIVPANDPGALIVRARQLLDDDRERGRMAEAGQRLYIALFNAPLSAQVLRDEKTDMERKSWWLRRERSDAI